MTSYIGYENLWGDGTVSASNEATGFEKENAYDWIGATQWKPGATGTQTLSVTFASATSVDYMGIAYHNLGTEGCTVTFQYLDETVSPVTWTNLVASISPSDDRSIFRYFTDQNATSYRIQITNCTADAVIGITSMGNALALPYAPRLGFTSARNDRTNRISNNVSDGGVFLGRSQYAEGRTIQINQEQVTETWVDANYDTLIDAILDHPFFFASDYENRINETPILWTDGAINHPSYSNYGATPLLSFSIACRGVL